MLILSGIIRSVFAKDKPINLTASITFEQSYGGVDGDSATAAEFIGIMSAITEIPIKQNIAITGSVNQLGDVQPIGGVNEKIKGFYEICKLRELTGGQGVLIPKQNVNDLMLCDELLEDVKAGKFHIYSFSRIEEAVEIMLGLPAGELDKKGKYPKSSVYRIVTDKLEKMRIKDEQNEKKKPKKKVKKDKTKQ